MTQDKNTISQNIVLIAIYAGLIVCIVLGVMNFDKYLGPDGFDNCMEHVCEGDAKACKKLRRMVHCCNSAEGVGKMENGIFVCIPLGG